MVGVVINTRCLSQSITGVQRYTHEILSRLPKKFVETVAPDRSLNGMVGHFWEQVMLPIKLKGKLLWSPANTGPILHKKQIVTIHDMVTFDHPEWYNARFSAWYQWILPKLSKNVSHIITVSEFSADRIASLLKISPEKITVTSLGVDARFKPAEKHDIDRVMKKFNIPIGRYILSVCSLVPGKNLKRLLEAWRMIYQALPEDISLVLAGASVSKVFSALNLTEIPPRVFFTGHVEDEDLPPLYAGAELFAFVSMYEGFGLPPLEAMACGTPVLTSHVASIPEVVQQAGVMVDPLSVESIADGLKNLVLDKGRLNELVGKGLKHAAKFSWDVTAEQTWKVLQKYL